MSEGPSEVVLDYHLSIRSYTMPPGVAVLVVFLLFAYTANLYYDYAKCLSVEIIISIFLTIGTVIVHELFHLSVLKIGGYSTTIEWIQMSVIPYQHPIRYTQCGNHVFSAFCIYYNRNWTPASLK